MNNLNNDLVVLDSPGLLKQDPLSVLRTLRDAYQPKSVSLFRTCEPSEGSFAPELTIIGVDPYEIIQSVNGVSTITTDGESTTRSGIPFQIVDELISERKAQSVAGLPFFQGGAMGYFSYDSVRFLEPSLSQFKTFENQKEHFDSEIVFYKCYLIFDRRKETVSLIHTENVLRKPSRPKKAHADVMAELKTLEGLALSAPHRPITFDAAAELGTEQMESNLGKQAFLDGIAKLKHHIREGDIFQAVLSEKFSIPYPGDPLFLFEVLATISPAPYQFYFSMNDRAYLGASPEMLLKATEQKIETHPIAGTRPRGTDAAHEERLEKDLLSDEKEKSEHLMLVDLSRNDIGRVSEPGTVKVESFQKIKKFGGVMHLVSIVTGILSSKINTLEALARSFPAGTLSGAPKIRAMDLITEVEKIPRGFYGGCFIVASFTGDVDSCIAIRSISVEKGVARIQAGAGIVADSVPEKEYEEIQHKSIRTRKALAIALKNQGAQR